MKKGHVAELIIDSILMLIGLILSMFSNYESPLLICFLSLFTCSVLEAIEYIFNRDKNEALFMSLALLISTVIIVFIKGRPAFSLAISFLLLTVLSLIIKVYSLKYIKAERVRLLWFRYIIISIFTILGILTSVATYYEMFSKIYLLSLFLSCFGLQELFCDVLIYIDEVKNVFKR